ncbi:MAG: VWA domain-containing protein [Sandaracinaceae bacterium]
MNRVVVAVASLLAAVWFAGCDCSGPHDPQGPCAGASPPPSCDQRCGAGEDACPIGFYCAIEGVCTQDCDPLTPDTNCRGGTCTEDGHCIGRNDPDAGQRDANNNCADVRVQAMRVTPNVILIIDQSGSMTSSFGGSNRWDALRDSLLAQPDGFIAALESSVRFGVAMYSADAPDNGPVPGECPLITWVPPALMNYAAIDAVYAPADPIDETPTGQSIDSVIDRLNMTPDPSTDPTIFILATDGEPDTCEVPNPQNGQPESLAAVNRAYSMGIRTYIISVGEEVSRGHLQDMANAGVGATGGMNAPFWVAGDDVGLRDALGTIIGGQLNCVVTLSGSIEDVSQACVGRVELNGVALPCDDPNGWRAIDSTHIELQGNACDTLQTTPGVTLSATFPCDIILI